MDVGAVDGLLAAADKLRAVERLAPAFRAAPLSSDAWRRYLNA
jgi:hypothetical protein